MLIDYIKLCYLYAFISRENEVTTPLVTDVIHCIFEYWTNSLLSIDRSDISTLLEDYFSLFPAHITNSNRLLYFLCLNSFLHQYISPSDSYD